MGILHKKIQTKKELQADFKSFVAQKSEKATATKQKPETKKEPVLETCE